MSGSDSAPVMMKRTHDHNIMTYRHDKRVSNDGNDQNNLLSVDISLVSMKP